MAWALEGTQVEFALSATANGQVMFSGLSFSGQVPPSEPFIFQLQASRPFPGPLGRDGYPTMGPFQFEGTGALRLFGSGSSSEGASGPASGTVRPY